MEMEEDDALWLQKAVDHGAKLIGAKLHIATTVHFTAKSKGCLLKDCAITFVCDPAVSVHESFLEIDRHVPLVNCVLRRVGEESPTAISVTTGEI